MPPSACSAPEVGLIGTINRDTIHLPDGTTAHSWGGLLYNLYYLNECGVRSRPAVNVGRDCKKQVLNIIRGLRHVDPSIIQIVVEKNNHCELFYTDHETKQEILRGGVPPLTLSRITSLDRTDLVLVNFISGRDVTLSALETFRHRFCGPIYVDLHSLTLGRRKVKDGYKRFLRTPRAWQRYLACADYIQMNKSEFELLAGKSFSGEALRTFCGKYFRGNQTAIITLGAKGACICRSGSRASMIPARRSGPVFDTTGCGDVFASGFVAEFLQSGDLQRSVRRGNELAAQRAALRHPPF
jgi:sugar/nucleoside kinase (ribokinase family)